MGKEKILVTGAGGFIGSHLCEELVKGGYSVRAMVRYSSKNLWGWLESSHLKDDIEVVTCDISDFDSVCSVVKGVDVVFHLSALIS
ncbi:MAG: SDR family NAD(P)-dependent oxidoreductase, partial [Candidatus Omnitrophica bacterium]|nr:SDR family NAD(P)-dependent oxidoreductase [Candidatus Omnitrophota bacterium]